MSIIDDFLKDAREHMDKSVDATRGKFGSIRTGRASQRDSRVARPEVDPLLSPRVGESPRMDL